MKFLFGTILGVWVGILLCALWLHSSYLPNQYQYELALMRCDAEKTAVSHEVRRVSNYLRGVSQ
jgi:hypothetical protein